METWIKQNKYIRLRIVEMKSSYRADLSINKYSYNKKENRYYEINYEIFCITDYSSKEETFNKAKEWLYKEFKLFQDDIEPEGGINGRKVIEDNK